MEKCSDTTASSEEQPSVPATPPYTSFTKRQLRLLRLLLGLAAITSPLTATIYFPLLPLLREHFHTSTQAINLTLTIYIVFQAVSPLIFGPLSDSYGRRPCFLSTLLLYFLANVGLAIIALYPHYAALLVLRAIQSLGASAAYSIAFGVVADVAQPRERGAMLGPVGMALNLGACVGPVLGGGVAYARAGGSGLVWVFWSLVVVAAVLLFGVGFLLPETARCQVGNGSDDSKFTWWQKSWLHLLQRRNHAKDEPLTTPAAASRPPFTWLRLLDPLRIMFHRQAALTLWVHGSNYVVDYVLVAAVPQIFSEFYKFNDLQLGLSYLPRGVGIIVGSYLTGRLMDHNYRRAEKRTSRQSSTDSQSGFNRAFPFEQARSRGATRILIISTTTTIGYGWAVKRHAHPAVLLVLQFIQGLWGTCFYTTYSTLLVDVSPESPASASAATSIIRCAMASTGVAILQPLLERIGYAWFFTALGLWNGTCAALAVVLLRWKGQKWRLKTVNASE